MRAPMRMKSWFETLTTKRALALALGPGALALGGDAALSRLRERLRRAPTLAADKILAVARVSCYDPCAGKD